MTWLALLLIGVGVSDLVFSVTRLRWVPEAVGATAVVLLGLVSGHKDLGDGFALLFIAVAVLAWGQTVTWAFGRGEAWVPLTLLGSTLVVLAVFGAHAEPVGGPLASLLTKHPVPFLAEIGPARTLLLVGVGLLQLSTGNVIVRLVLRATGSRNPHRVPLPDQGEDHGQSEATPLKGGRLLGPMERVLIVGLGVAGQLTAASVVIAAKGLLRFPELQAARDQSSPDIHEVTEYFLVGSFVSWLLALGSVVVLVA